MNKFLKIAGDAACTVGCCIGVGFLSGKEAQAFVGNVPNALLFAAVVGLCNFALREFCRRANCFNVEDICKNLHPICSIWLNCAIVLCCFVCTVTALAGVETCLSNLLDVRARLPLFAFGAAVISGVLTAANLKTLKAVNAIAIGLSAALLVIATTNRQPCPPSPVPPLQPIVYALFTVTMNLGITARLAADCSAKENAAASAVTATALCLTLVAILPLCDFSAELPLLSRLGVGEKRFAALVLLCAAATGLAANAMPVAEFVQSVVPDKTLSVSLVFTLALALSSFGFDFALRFGYAAVAAVGAYVVLRSFVALFRYKKRPLSSYSK